MNEHKFSHDLQNPYYLGIPAPVAAAPNDPSGTDMSRGGICK